MKKKSDTMATNGGSYNGRQLKWERERLVLWRHPFRTLSYFLKECGWKVGRVAGAVAAQRRRLMLAGVVLCVGAAVCWADGGHQAWLAGGRAHLWWSLYWLGLGVLSSIGLGTGLHTFLLYLGPHIASVTMAAYECGALNFPAPPYPDDIVCPDQIDPRWSVSIWNIMRKVSLEAIMWGTGTALGELPPYFMARTARLSGVDPDEDEELKEFEELQRRKDEHPETLSLLDRAILLMENLVNKAGFFGILLCASVPNPLFDLAGIACGHFLVPFWTFFAATLIGKALIKMMVQSVFVIVAFSETLISSVTSFLAGVPVVGASLEALIEGLLRVQREKLHRGHDTSSRNPLSTIFELFVLSMVAYFLVSIINTFAQNYHKRITKPPASKKKNKD